MRRLALLLVCWAVAVRAGDFTMPGNRGRIRPSPAPTAAQQVFGTNGDIAPNGSVAATTMFASFMGEDDREAAVQMPINTVRRVWNNLRCKASGVPGTGNITIQGRQGACGSLANSGSACVITSAATTCGPINSPLSVTSAGNCVDWSITTDISNNVVQVVCTVEQTG